MKPVEFVCSTGLCHYKEANLKGEERMSGDHNRYQKPTSKSKDEWTPDDMAYRPDGLKMIECGTCGYPLAEDERAGLVEVDGKMQKPWVYLTNEDIDTLVLPDSDRLFMRDLARIVEAKIKHKNAPDKQAQYFNDLCDND